MSLTQNPAGKAFLQRAFRRKRVWIPIILVIVLGIAGLAAYLRPAEGPGSITATLAHC